MILTVQIALCIVFLLILWQDQKDRAVHWGLFLIAGLGALYMSILSQISMNHLFSNLLFVGIVMLGLAGYIFLKTGKVFNFFKTHFGIGDVLFFIVTSPLFERENFILFFISGLVLSMLVFRVFKKSQKENTIPLAGYLSGYLIVLITLEICDFFHPFYNNILSQL